MNGLMDQKLYCKACEFRFWRRASPLTEADRACPKCGHHPCSVLAIWPEKPADDPAPLVRREH